MRQALAIFGLDVAAWAAMVGIIILAAFALRFWGAH